MQLSCCGYEDNTHLVESGPVDLSCFKRISQGDVTLYRHHPVGSTVCPSQHQNTSYQLPKVALPVFASNRLTKSNNCEIDVNTSENVSSSHSSFQMHLHRHLTLRRACMWPETKVYGLQSCRQTRIETLMSAGYSSCLSGAGAYLLIYDVEANFDGQIMKPAYSFDTSFQADVQRTWYSLHAGRVSDRMSLLDHRVSARLLASAARIVRSNSRSSG